MKLKKELRAVKEINEQERKKRDEPGANHHHHDNLNHHDDHHDSDDRDAKKASQLSQAFPIVGLQDQNLKFYPNSASFDTDISNEF